MSSEIRAQRSWPDSVRDMISFCNRVLDHTAGLDQQLVVSTQVVYDATLRNLTLIGQAAAHVPDSVRGVHPEIPWRNIVGARNHLMHRYFVLDDELIWQMVTVDVPSLLPLLRNLLESSEQDFTSHL